MSDSIPGIKINELPEAEQSQLTDTSVAVVDDGTTTRKTKLSTFVLWLKSKLCIDTMQEDINNLNTNTPVAYTGYDPSGKFEAIDDANSWIRVSRSVNSRYISMQASKLKPILEKTQSTGSAPCPVARPIKHSMGMRSLN